MAQRFPKKARCEKHGDTSVDFDNTGRRSLLVPGFGAMRVPIEVEERFASGFGDWRQRRLTAREIAMLQLMNIVTDRPNWSVEIYESTVIAHWASELSSSELISPAAWSWCVAELRDKALYHGMFNLTHVFDSASRICKSDRLISADLLKGLAAEVEALTKAPDILYHNTGLHHGRSEDDTQVHMVDPDLFSLMFGETCVLSDGGVTGTINAADRFGQGSRSQEQSWACSRSLWGRCDGNPTRGMRGVPRGREQCHVCRHVGSSPEKSWQGRAFMFSRRYQWLPSEVCFGPAGNRTRDARLTSYINNLHPRQNFSLYRSIERIIEASIQPWNEILVRPGKGRTPERIRTYGVQWSPQEPTAVDLEELDEIMQSGQGELHQATKAWLHEFLAQPDNPRAPPPSWQYPLIQADWAATYSPSAALKLKYRRCKKWLHPEPGAAFTYDEWKAGRNNRAVVPGRMLHWRKLTDLPPKEDHAFYTVSLESDFAQQGLQVVVEIGAVELTPAQPTREATGWQLTGLLGDHIVATTLVYFATENVTHDSGAVSFRVEADLDPIEHVWGNGTGSSPHHALAPLADIYGLDSHLDLSNDASDDETLPGAPALQELGTVATPDGRLLAFPNVMQHRVEAFRLLDASKPGRRRFLKLHLVDPHYRLCSTRNTPPQQPGWWSEAGWERVDWRARRMPMELVQSIQTMVGDVPPNAIEVEKRREELQEERRRKQQQVFDEEVAAYMFGQHAAIGRKFLR